MNKSIIKMNCKCLNLTSIRVAPAWQTFEYTSIFQCVAIFIFIFFLSFGAKSKLTLFGSISCWILPLHQNINVARCFILFASFCSLLGQSGCEAALRWFVEQLQQAGTSCGERVRHSGSPDQAETVPADRRQPQEPDHDHQFVGGADLVWLQA